MVCFSIPLEAQTLRGVWIDTRSIPPTREEVKNLLGRLHRFGVNAVFVESFYQGETIYPSPFLASLGLHKQRETFAQAGIDPLQVFVEEAHRLSMEVHAWIHMFYISLNNPGGLLSLYPHWAVVNREGKPGYQSGNNFFFWLCPMEEEVENFYLQLLTELAERYPVDGIQLDYFRFPEFTLADTCYAESHRKMFTEQYGIDPLTLSPTENPQMYTEWTEFRSQQLTNFARHITKALKEKFPKLTLSCAVKPMGFPLGLYPGTIQDWPIWGKEGLFDFLVPMTYSSRPAEFEGLLRWAGIFLEGTPFAPGIWTVNMNPESVLEEVKRAYHYPIRGVILFAYPYLNDDTFTLLAQGPFRRAPTEDKTFPPISFYQEKRRMVRARSVTQTILIDGALDEAVWQEADWQKSFTTITGEKASRDTSVAVLYDTENLYCAFRLTDVSSSSFEVQKRDGPVFYEPSIEVFLDPYGGKGIWYQIATNYGGVIYDSFSLRGPSFNGSWKVATSFDSSSLTLAIEMALPFQDLGKTPKRGEIWGANFYRNEPQAGELSGLSPIPGIYAAPTLLGQLLFEE